MVRWESQKEAALWAALRIYFACAIKHHLIFDSYNMFYCFSIKRSYSMQLPEKWQGLHMQSPKPAVIHMPQTVMKFIAKRRPMCDNSN